jgi:hypothetical protein
MKRVLAIMLALPAAAAWADAGNEFFESKVRPLLIEHCYECHSGEKTKGGLALDTKAGWEKGGDSGPAILPGTPDASLLIKAVRYQDDDLAMPPQKKGVKLPDGAIASLIEWVKMGAPDPRVAEAKLGGMSADEAKSWWAFQPLPQADKARSIDDFILTKLSEAKLQPAAPADPRTLIRRATYDLTGLPPTPEEVEAFVANPAPDAIAQLIDRLLDSPQYGVQWGRHWLDVVRYADTAGENTDRPLPHAWRYRNWVMDALNDDMPYDEFVKLQLAGDVLNENKADTERSAGIIATGYLAIARRFGHDIDKDMHLTFEDVIDNVGKNFLGLTTGCARCHDHKYDPITAKDYYALYGIFESTRFAFPGCEPKGQPRDMVPLIQPAQIEAIMKPWRERQAQVEAENKRLTDKVVEIEPAPVIPVAYAVVEGKAKNSRFHQRGDPEMLGEEVPRRWLSAFGGDTVLADAGSGRKQLGDWMMQQPITARVMVNRIWQWHFGSGLVHSPNDFGARGEKPTHPELLDWLAGQFVASGYSVKAMHRRIMHTAAYQRASATSPAADLLSHFTRRRFTAEEMRDSLLFVSGQLDATPAEAHPFPPEKTWTFTQHDPFTAVYETTKRSAYLMVQRQRRHPFLSLFDGADPNASTATRQTTTVPTQALYFINDSFFHAQADAFATSLIKLATDEARIEQAYRLLFQRQCSASERERCETFLAGYPAAPQEKWAAYARVLLASNEFMHLD